MVVTMPSPTRAMIVSSVAPPINWRMLVRTVTRALPLTWMPSLATASMVTLPVVGLGQSMTFGFTDVWTASRMSRPARSIAQACFHVRSMPARLAAIIALTTLGTRPRAR